jgi:hypothetical protein
MLGVFWGHGGVVAFQVVLFVLMQHCAHAAWGSCELDTAWWAVCVFCSPSLAVCSSFKSLTLLSCQ